MKALCFGPLNIDYTYQVPHFVMPGESLVSTGLQTFPGGKGLNQAIALAKCGVDTWIAGAIGPDGRFLMDVLNEAGVHTELLQLLKEQATGHAIIQRQPDGENGILLHSGANHCITEDMIDRALENFGEGDLLVVQNEINALPQIISRAHEKKMTVAVNASPVDDVLRSLPPEQLDILMLNRVEAAQLLKLPQDTDRQQILDRLGEEYPETQIVMTSGTLGARILSHGRLYHQHAYPVEAVDTTSAGDTFAGYYLGTLLHGGTMAEAADKASRAAAICVTREGASPSIPTALEVEGWQPPVKNE